MIHPFLQDKRPNSLTLISIPRHSDTRWQTAYKQAVISYHRSREVGNCFDLVICGLIRCCGGDLFAGIRPAGSGHQNLQFSIHHFASVHCLVMDIVGTVSTSIALAQFCYTTQKRLRQLRPDNNLVASIKSECTSFKSGIDTREIL